MTSKPNATTFTANTTTTAKTQQQRSKKHPYLKRWHLQQQQQQQQLQSKCDFFLTCICFENCRPVLASTDLGVESN